MNPSYIKTVRLLLAVAPTIFKDSPFVLKGGTAINLFLRDMPRLSVDLDLVVADHRLSRDEAFRLISSALDSMAAELSKAGYICEVGATRDGDEVKLFIQQDRTRLKVEVEPCFPRDSASYKAALIGAQGAGGFPHRPATARAPCG